MFWPRYNDLFTRCLTFSLIYYYIQFHFIFALLWGWKVFIFCQAWLFIFLQDKVSLTKTFVKIKSSCELLTTWIVYMEERYGHTYIDIQDSNPWPSLNFFFRLSFRNYISSVYNCDDLPSNNSSLRSSHIRFSYIHYFIIILSRVYNEPI